ncbi:Protein CBR-SRD-50 [Caenorhabditis briggsae]|uniref:Protein CBR-SRD-50 n=1 Tax=Caenorhabditis briggsae TaxID=6238 RepID=A8X4R6_CAEBR|nr:Protein CBR-SRD-50 [Caenorhabditis briggsae]CAP27626.2 Protein CBR-SRD-50 [Caenorhabditis briggsae]
MMSPLESQLVLIFTVFFNVYLFSAISAQLLLLFLIKTCKVTALKDMRLYLLNILILQFISTMSAFLSQSRVVPNSETVAILCYGPCKYLGVLTCQVLFHVLKVSLFSCAAALIIAFYYRYNMITARSFTRTHHYRQLVISYSIPTVLLVFNLFSPSDRQKIVNELTALHPSYDLDNYIILGFSEVKTVVASVNTAMIILGVYGTPFVALYFRSKILKILNTTKSYHSEKIAQTKSMIQGLTLQTLLPLFCYIPSFTYFIYNQHYQTDSLIVEFAVSPIGFIYTIFDPLLTIYFVLPYRRGLKAMFQKNNTTTNIFIISETTRRIV